MTGNHTLLPPGLCGLVLMPQELKRKGAEQRVGFCHESSSPSPHPAFTDKDNTDYTHRENTMHLKGKEINVSSNVTTPTLIAIFLDAQQ